MWTFFDATELLRSPGFEITATAFGLVVGSFANVCIHRLPLGRSVVRPRSYCPSCRTPIRAWQNVPVLSFLFLRGRCASCAAPISWRYPLVEATHGAAYLAIADSRGPGVVAVVLMGFVSALLILSLIDFDHQILPDVITLPGIVAGLLATLLPGWPVTTREALVAGAAGYLALAAVATAYHRLRGIEGLGRGDWKMVAMLGAFLGWQHMLLAVFWATVLGSLVGATLILWFRRDARYALPFGTFLGIAALAVVFFGDAVLAWYRALLDA